MKRLLCLFFALCLLLSACGNKTAEVPTEPSIEAPTTEATEAPTTEATEAPTTEPAPTEPPVPVNPLTGEELEEEYTGRPVMFTINNAYACLPQYGLSQLDWMFEVETEGGITRCIGLMTDLSDVGVVGPIRSCRTYFLNLSVSYNAPLFHCGGSPFADQNQYNVSDALPSWDHVNEKAYSGYFYRDNNRYKNQGYAWEHTLFTNGELMAKAMEERGYNPTGNEPVSYGYLFGNDVQLDGQSASKVTAMFRGDKKTIMEYNADTKLYQAHQYGKDWVDGATGENAAFRNLLFVFAEQSVTATTHSFYDLDGSGDGYFAVDGKMVPIKWQHKDAEGPFSFTLEDGTPITLGVGSTYCAIIDVSGSVTAE